MSISLPPYIEDALQEAAGPGAVAATKRLLRDPAVVMKARQMGGLKASRVSFAYVLARKMAEQRWTVTLRSSQFESNGKARLVYRIDANGHAFTYIAHAYEWDGKEKVGRRSDGANRDMFGALFVGLASNERIEREFATFDLRNIDTMRTDAEVLGWTPANRSARVFDHVVEALAAGHQPEIDLIGSSSGYLLRNGGFQGSGRNGSISYAGIPAGHPLRHPYFADLFALYLVRQVSIDMVNGFARARNPRAVALAPEIAAFLGVGNSSGQGMVVALQRWPHWVSTWVTVRETALAYAKSIPVAPAQTARLRDLLDRVARFYESVQVPTEDYVVPNRVIAANLRTLRDWLATPADFASWAHVAAAAEVFDHETREQLNSILIDLFPEVSDRLADCLALGSLRERRAQPAATVGALKMLLRNRYAWALEVDQRQSSARRHFWYHSEDNGEQRRGDRGLDPHEEFESFIDHIGLIQRLACVAAAMSDDALVGELLFEHPDLELAVSRVQYLGNLPYSEIQDNLIDQEFLPANLIRFFLGILGMECSTPLSIRYVRGVFFQGAPLPENLAQGARLDWRYPVAQRAETGVLR
jgi:hypothetical protein